MLALPLTRCIVRSDNINFTHFNSLVWNILSCNLDVEKAVSTTHEQTCKCVSDILMTACYSQRYVLISLSTCE